MHFVYIIYSKHLNQFYVGESEDFEVRIIQHNEGFFKGASTKRTSDWCLRLLMQVANRIEGRKIEDYIKSMKSRKFLEKLIADKDFQERFKRLVKEKFEISLLFP